MLVVAFDGVLFDTLPVRATAVTEALAAEGLVVAYDAVWRLLPSLSLAEAVRAAAVLAAGNGAGLPPDDTALELATLRAERSAAALTMRGAALNVAVRERMRGAAGVTRIAVRADSARDQAETLLAMADLDGVVSMLRCSDDPVAIQADATLQLSAHRSYEHIIRRLAGNKQLLGESSAVGIALEASLAGQRVAQGFGFETPAHVHALNQY